MNRIINAVSTTKQMLNKRVADGLVTVEQVEETRQKMDLSFEEYCLFQEKKSLAVANRILTLDEGMTVYAYMGETPETFNKQPIEVKVTLMQLFRQLLEGGRKRA